MTELLSLSLSPSLSLSLSLSLSTHTHTHTHTHTESQEQLRRAIPKYANLDQRPPFTYAALIRQVCMCATWLSNGDPAW